MSMRLRLQHIVLWGHKHSIKHQSFKMMALQTLWAKWFFFMDCLVYGRCWASCNTRNTKPASSFSVLSLPVAASTVGSRVLSMGDWCIERQNDPSLLTSTTPHTAHIHSSLSRSLLSLLLWCKPLHLFILELLQILVGSLLSPVSLPITSLATLLQFYSGRFCLQKPLTQMT